MNQLFLLLRLGCLLPKPHSRRECECIGQKKLSEAGDLRNFGFRHLFFIVSTGIAVQSYDMRPLFQIASEPACTMKRVDSRGQILRGQRGVELSRCHVERLAVHGCRGIHISAFRIIRALLERSQHHWRNMLRRGRSESFWVHADNVRRILSRDPPYFAGGMGQPVDTHSPCLHLDTYDLMASIALEHRSRMVDRDVRGAGERHPNLFRQAVRTIANVGNRHV